MAPSSAPAASPPQAPNGADLWWPGKAQHDGGNVRVVAAPDGWPVWVSPVRPGREHVTTRACHHGLTDAFNRIATELDMPPQVDLGYQNAGDGFRHPHKKSAESELTEAQQALQQEPIRGIHGICERANSLLKTTLKPLRRVSLNLSRITKIAAAALVLLHLACDRTIGTITQRHDPLLGRLIL